MSREAVLAALRAHQGDAQPLPALPAFPRSADDTREAAFRTMVERVGGSWTTRHAEPDLGSLLRSHYPDVGRLVSTLDEPPESTMAVGPSTPPADLVTVELAVLRGVFGVAENAAIWVDETSLPHRALPFVAEHCVILLDRRAIVHDMHGAYERLAGHGTGYGVFISGPSKTADIEQSLVMGAQGPRSLLVVLDGHA